MIREKVLQALRRRNKTEYWMARQMEADGLCCFSAAYRWLRGVRKGREHEMEGALRLLKIEF